MPCNQGFVFSFIRSRFLNAAHMPRTSHIYSSVWSSIKHCFIDIQDNSQWLASCNSNLNFWNDNWLRISISDQLAIPPSFRKNLKAKISDFYVQNSWHLPHQFKMAFPMLSADIENVTFSYSAEDSFVFRPSKNGQVSCKVFYHFYRPNGSRVAWGRDL